MSTETPSSMLPRVEATDFFALRTPLLSHDELTAWCDGLQSAISSNDPDRLREALAKDRQLLRARLRTIALRPEVREALFLASASLEASLPIWLESPDSERGQKVERSLVKYFLRMTTRPTPFGLFAGCSLGSIGASTQFRLTGLANYRRDVRLDGDYLSALATELGRSSALRRTLVFRPNSSLYQVGERLRYAKVNLGEKRSYNLVLVAVTEAIAAALDAAGSGARVAVIAAVIVAKLAAEEVTNEEAEDFVDELIDEQILVPDLDPLLTSADSLHEFIGKISQSEATTTIATQLALVRDKLHALARLPLGVPTEEYRLIATDLPKLPTNADLARQFQVDMFKPAQQIQLGPGVIAEITQAVSLVHRLSPQPRSKDLLSRFRRQFEERYGEREVPLAEVLDDDIGIGFERSTTPSAEPSPLLEGLPFVVDSMQGEMSVGPNFVHLLSKLTHALKTGAHEIALDNTDVEKMLSNDDPSDLKGLPDSLAAVFTLAARSERSIDEGDFLIWLHNTAGPSGATLLGRFCQADQDLECHVRRYLKLEESRRPEAIFAEIVHLPQGRLGNVLCRPVLRERELPYLGRSGANRENQILLEDLLVSVRGNRIVLRSRRLEREIFPRMTTALNFLDSAGLTVFRFLGALQFQDAQPFQFRWGCLESAEFLPRVRYKRTVLALARWRLGREVLQSLASGDQQQDFAAAQALRSRHGLPRWVAVVDGDNTLPIDLDNVLAVDVFVRLVRNRRQVILTELFGTDGLCVKGPEGGFTNEIVLPLVALHKSRPTLTEDADTVTAAPRSVVQPREVNRRFPPGSEWLYAKIYASPAACDDVLRNTVAPVVAKAIESGAADTWFFMRYADPDSHLRLRFHGNPTRLHNEVHPLLASFVGDAIKREEAWKFQLDTYERELERYGGPEGISLSEQIFRFDSDAVLNILLALSGDNSSDARWQIALRGMDRILDDFGYSLEAKRRFVGRCRASLRGEFGPSDDLDRGLGDKFRAQRASVEMLLTADRGTAVSPSLFAVLAERSSRLIPIGESVQKHISDGQVTVPLDELVTSWIHMHINRLLRGAHRAQELVLYDLLERGYTGQLARRSMSGRLSAKRERT